MKTTAAKPEKARRQNRTNERRKSKMKKYKEIRPAAANKGDFLTVYEAVYKEPKDGRQPRRWNKRFTNKLQYYVLAEQPKNSGYCTVKNAQGKISYLSISQVWKAYRNPKNI